MTMCPGTGLLSQMIECGLAAGSCRMGARPELVTLPVCMGTLVVRLPRWCVPSSWPVPRRPARASRW